MHPQGNSASSSFCPFPKSQNSQSPSRRTWELPSCSPNWRNDDRIVLVTLVTWIPLRCSCPSVHPVHPVHGPVSHVKDTLPQPGGLSTLTITVITMTVLTVCTSNITQHGRLHLTSLLSLETFWSKTGLSRSWFCACTGWTFTSQEIIVYYCNSAEHTQQYATM